jgi:hypothetical protein
MNTRLRIILPSVMGAISSPLVIWAIYNQRVIASMGMGWDTGAPIWPYQTPQFLLYFLNYPAHYIAQPMANHLGLVSPEDYFLLFPTTLIWWWLLGRQLDHGLVGEKSRGNWLFFAILVALAVLFLWAAVIAAVDALRWWFQYGESVWTSSTLLMMLQLAPVVWGCALGLGIAIAAKRVAAQQLDRSTKDRQSSE